MMAVLVYITFVLFFIS